MMMVLVLVLLLFVQLTGFAFLRFELKEMSLEKNEWMD